MARRAKAQDPNEMTGPKETLRVTPKPNGRIDYNVLARMLPEIMALSEAHKNKPRTPENNPYRIATHPPYATPPKPLTMAMDNGIVANNEWAGSQWLQGAASEGLVWPGFTYLSELAQRPEYRVISETIADDATRKWIDFDVTGNEDENRRRSKLDPVGEAERALDPDERKKRVKKFGKTDKVKALKDDQVRLEVRDRFYALARDDGLFGRSHLYMNFGEDVTGNSKELATPIGDGRGGVSQRKIKKGSFKELKTIEAIWSYPLAYNAVNPLADGWYKPKRWYVMGTEIDVSRMPCFIGRPVPDLLKPAYSFGGISLSQMSQPYVDIWLRTRQSVADLIHSFSVMVLMTDLSTLLQPGDAGGLVARAALFNQLRDNQGLMIVNKDSEDFKNVSASLSGLHELQAQAQEHLCFPGRYPLVKLTGIQPSGLNASSDGEIRMYYDTVSAYQNRFFLRELTRVVDFEQLSLWGETDPEITLKFEPLWEESAQEKAERQKAEVERHQIYVDLGAISQEEVRKVAVADPDLPYTELDPDEMPDLEQEEAEGGLEPRGGNPKVLAEEVEGGEEGAEKRREAA